MPASVRRTPFVITTAPSPPPDLALRTPQARLLAALVPRKDTDYLIDWPIWTRAMLAVRAGYTAISGTVTRALNGIREGSSSGDAHPGLLARGMIEEVIVDIEGTKEVNYRATPLGVKAYRAHEAKYGPLPALRDKETCTNDRYKKSAQETENK